MAGRLRSAIAAREATPNQGWWVIELDLQGHRGARGLRPENTLPGLAKALSIGVSSLEIDVGISADGVVVLSHDRSLNPDLTRDPDGRWIQSPGPLIHSMPVAGIQYFDVGRIKSGTLYSLAFPEQQPVDGARIPTLDEAIALVRDSGDERVRFNIEAKLSPLEPESTPPPREFATRLIETVRNAGFEKRVWIQSFDWRILRDVHELAPEIATSCLTVQQSDLNNLAAHDGHASPWLAGIDPRDHEGSVPHAVQACGASAWAPHHKELSREDCERALNLGLDVLVWTVNRPAAMRKMIEMGVTGVISDYPDRLRSMAGEMGRPLPEPTPVDEAAI